MPKKVILVILDGWGIGSNDESNPIYVAQPPVLTSLAHDYPVTSLAASGIAVGLPWGEVGNSEVGHLTLGAGKVLYQYYPKITMAIRDGSFFKNQFLIDAFAHAKKNNAAVNFAGLLSKGNVHASMEHLQALIKMARDNGVMDINLHLFADGKDTPPRSLQMFLVELPKEYLATLVGRYYAMDRNGNWKITETCYLAMTGQAGTLVDSPDSVIAATYAAGNTEEYLPPLRFSETPPSLKNSGLPPSEASVTERGRGKSIKDGDALVFFNYREDSMRQIASAFITKNFAEFPVVHFENLFIVTMTHYDDRFDVPVAFPADIVEDPFGKVISDAGLPQLRIAETYKYAHVTYFFNGLREPPFPGEYRTLVPSASDLHPEKDLEMMAKAVTDRAIEAIASRAFDFTLVNYANADTMAHTANYDAAVEAVRILDREVGRLVAAAEQANAVLVITSDHGNIEEMTDPATGLPESQHDASPVPLYLVDSEYRGRKFINGDQYTSETLGSLADVAPTLLEIMGIPKPAKMTGDSLMDKLI